MSTDPAPTPGPEEAPDATADAAIEHIEKASPSSPVEGEAESGLDVTPHLSPPSLRDPTPPLLVATEGDATEKRESPDEEESATNLAYEDMLAKLAAATQAPGPEPETPTVETASSLLASSSEQTPISPTPSMTPSGPSMLATPVRRYNQVSPKALLSDEDDPTIPGHRAAVAAQPMIVRGAGLAHPEPLVSVQGGARSRLIHLALGGALVVGGMFLAVVVLRVLMPRPVSQAPAGVAPSMPPPPPTYTPPIQIEPLPGTASAEMPALPADSAATATPRDTSGAAPGQPQRSPRKTGLRPKTARPSAALAAGAPEGSSAAEPTTAGKGTAAATAPTEGATPPSGKKSGSKSSAYVDPFE